MFKFLKNMFSKSDTLVSMYRIIKCEVPQYEGGNVEYYTIESRETGKWESVCGIMNNTFSTFEDAEKRLKVILFNKTKVFKETVIKEYH